MGCNAWNHSSDCDCGFGGDSGGGSWGSRSQWPPSLLSWGWSRDNGKSIESYTNPNALCPVCGAAVFFYQSPYGGRVFFDHLGPPWPKHPCTDNSTYVRRATRLDLAMRPENLRAGSPPRAGWQPLLYSKTHRDGGRSMITGDIGDHFTELEFLADESFDNEGPILVRVGTDTPGLAEVAVLDSDHFTIRHKVLTAIDVRLGPIGRQMALAAQNGDGAALMMLGQHLLYELGDPASARIYLEAAYARGEIDAAYDLAVVALFSPAATNRP